MLAAQPGLDTETITPAPRAALTLVANNQHDPILPEHRCEPLPEQPYRGATHTLNFETAKMRLHFATESNVAASTVIENNKTELVTKIFRTAASVRRSAERSRTIYFDLGNEKIQMTAEDYRPK